LFIDCTSYMKRKLQVLAMGVFSCVVLLRYERADAEEKQTRRRLRRRMGNEP